MSPGLEPRKLSPSNWGDQEEEDPAFSGSCPEFHGGARVKAGSSSLPPGWVGPDSQVLKHLGTRGSLENLVIILGSLSRKTHKCVFCPQIQETGAPAGPFSTTVSDTASRPTLPGLRGQPAPLPPGQALRGWVWDPIKGDPVKAPCSSVLVAITRFVRRKTSAPGGWSLLSKPVTPLSPGVSTRRRVPDAPGHPFSTP